MMDPHYETGPNGHGTYKLQCWCPIGHDHTFAEWAVAANAQAADEAQAAIEAEIEYAGEAAFMKAHPGVL